MFPLLVRSADGGFVIALQTDTHTRKFHFCSASKSNFPMEWQTEQKAESNQTGQLASIRCEWVSEAHDKRLTKIEVKLIERSMGLSENWSLQMIHPSGAHNSVGIDQIGRRSPRMAISKWRELTQSHTASHSQLINNSFCWCESSS